MMMICALFFNGFLDPIKTNVTAARPQASKIDFDTLVREQAGMSDFGSKARQGTAAIGDIRKAELAKDLDPTELRVSVVVLPLILVNEHFLR